MRLEVSKGINYRGRAMWGPYDVMDGFLYLHYDGGKAWSGE